MPVKSVLFLLFFSVSLHANTDSLLLEQEVHFSEKIQQLWEEGLHAKAAGNYNKAILLIDSSLCLLQNELSWAHPLSAVAMNHLGNIYFDQSYIEPAYYYHSQALKIRLRYFGTQALETAKSYNNLANCHLAIGDYATAVDLYQKTAAIRQKTPDVSPLELASVYNNLGNSYLSLGQLMEAKRYYEKALKIRLALLKSSDIKVAQSRLSLGNVFAALQMADSALHYFEEALVVYEGVYNENHSKLADIYENMGNVLVTQGAFLQAEQRLNKALLIRQLTYGEQHPVCTQSYQNLGELWFQKGDFQQAYYYFDKALNLLLKQWGEYHPQVAQAYEQIGFALLYQGKTATAKPYFLQSAALRQSLFGANHPFVAGSWLNLGNVFWKEKNYEQARQYFKQSLEIWNKYGTEWRGDQLKAAFNICETYLEQGNLNKAQQALQKAELFLGTNERHHQADYWLVAGKIACLGGEYLKADTLFTKAIQLLGFDMKTDTHQVFSIGILQVLQHKADNLLLLAQNNGDIEQGKAAFSVFETTMQGLSDLQNSYSNPEARQQMAALYQPLFESAIATALYLADKTKEASFYDRKALIFSEKNKSIRLLESILKHQQAIKDHQHLLLNEDKLKAVQLRLSDEETIISFFQGEKNKYVFVVTKDRVFAHSLDEKYQWEDAITGLGKSIIQFPVVNSAAQSQKDSIYQYYASEIYTQLFDVLGQHIKNKDHLLIIPDGIFSWLPFEVLLTKPVKNALKFRNYPYLIHDFTVSYAYSISQWINNQNRPVSRSESKYACLALAPEFKDNEALFSPLEHNLSESKKVLEHFNGTLLKGEKATQVQFLSQAGEYAILHLATHGKTDIYNGDDGFLVLAADDRNTQGGYSKLYVKNLYQQKWKAQLAVLSACETGVGSFKPGEGVISLGRGFTQAGVRSIVSTLWHINDAKTAQLMDDFYRSLKASQPKHNALRKAKLNQLQQGSHELAHPFYWAAYLPYGDMQPLAIENVYRKWWWLLGVTILLLLFVQIKKWWGHKF